MRHSITIDRASYEIDPSVDISDLKAELEAAVRTGGQFVSIVVVRDRLLDVLITPGLTVRIETTQARGLEAVPALEDSPVQVFDEFDEFDDL